MTALLDSPTPPIRDQEQLRRFDDCSFEAFYRAEFQSLVGLGHVLYGSGFVAEDLAQDAFAKAHQQWPKIRHYDKPDAWVRRVLINGSRSRFRRAATETKALTRLLSQREEVVELPECSEQVWGAVRSLPRRQAQVVALRYWDGLSINEIAEVLGCGSETVKTHLKRAKATLAIELAEGEEAPPMG